MIPKLGEIDERTSGTLQVMDTPSGKELHIFQSPSDREYLIEWTTDELTSLCPVTGHPDFCFLTVRYVPDERCLELKSVKFYIESFRNEGHFYEELINLIYEDLETVLLPRRLEVSGEFNIRGGIPETVIVGKVLYE